MKSNIKQNQLLPETRAVLDNAERFILLSLDPRHPRVRGESVAPAKENFHGWGVLGKTDIRSGEERAELLGALYNGIAESEGVVAACFNPRHGLSASLGNETVDLVICFECLWMQTHHKETGCVLTTRSPQSVLDRTLEKHIYQLSKRNDHATHVKRFLKPIELLSSLALAAGTVAAIVVRGMEEPVDPNSFFPWLWLLGGLGALIGGVMLISRLRALALICVLGGFVLLFTAGLYLEDARQKFETYQERLNLK